MAKTKKDKKIKTLKDNIKATKVKIIKKKDNVYEIVKENPKKTAFLGGVVAGLVGVLTWVFFKRKKRD